MALADSLLTSSESVFDTVTDALVDAGELVLDATLGSADGKSMTGRKLRRAILVLLLVGGLIGVALWRRGQARGTEEGAASGASS